MDICISELLSGVYSKTCITLLIAKSFGIAAIIISSASKIPQIQSIINKKTAGGISSTSSYSDLLSVIFQGLYCLKVGLPLTLSGEYISLVIQNALIILLAWYYGESKHTKATMIQKIGRIIFVLSLLTFSYICIYQDIIPKIVWDLMGASNLPFVTISRLTQIVALVKTKDTGAISLSSYFLRFAKNIIKSIALVLESNDYILLVNQIYNGVMSMAVASLIIYYRKGNKIKKE